MRACYAPFSCPHLVHCASGFWLSQLAGHWLFSASRRALSLPPPRVALGPSSIIGVQRNVFVGYSDCSNFSFFFRAVLVSEIVRIK
jgi:hypothetical protein